MKGKKIILAVVAAVLLVGAVVVLGASAYTVAEDEYACVMRFSKVEQVKQEAGLYFRVPFIESIKKMPKNSMLYDIKPSDVLTAEKKAMIVDSYVVWRISDPMKFIRTLNSTPEAEKRIDASTYNALKNIMGTLEQNDIITPSTDTGRYLLENELTKQVDGVIAEYGIEVLDVKIKRLDLPTDNEQAVFTRMISERTQIAEGYRAEGEYEASMIRNNVDKEIKIILSDANLQAEQLKAEGEAEYMRILAAAYDTDDKKSFYEYIRALDALKTSLANGQTTVILDKDSPLASILAGQ